MQEACTVGVSTDGTASNIAAAKLKGLVEKRLDCFFLDVVPCTLTGASCQGCTQGY